MHETLEDLHENLEKVISQVRSAIPNDEPFGTAHGNWSFPGLTRAELIEEAQSIADLIESQGGDDLGEHETRLQDYVRRLQHLQQQTVAQIWGNAGQAVPAYLLTLQGLRKSLEPVLTRDGRVEAAAKLKRLAQQLRGMESRLNSLDPRTAALSTMVERIEQAYTAADQLPADLDTLAEARQKITDLVKDATRDQGDVLRIREGAGELDEQLNKIADDAKAVLAHCETAYSAATSVGLAAAFSERSSVLSKSMWFWVAGLVAALAAGSYFGSAQLHSLTELFKVPNVAASVVFLNLLLSVLSVGAPVWFAWLATKQIGQRFRLAEDYAFKASISRAYEGFRREAARFDKDMEAKLLTSALTRLDELPLRLVETDSHGSPWHELASSNVVKQAMQAVPGFSEQIKDLASKALATVTTPKVSVTSASSGEDAASSGKNKGGDA
ncbi:MAG: hypothetical protein BroJett010_10710 [Gammaproteobacteria bacterium]|nr:MAG: hypothetical protein BroJett010_10710 [Gammaproteobacteria bacterium]